MVHVVSRVCVSVDWEVWSTAAELAMEHSLGVWVRVRCGGCGVRRRRKWFGGYKWRWRWVGVVLVECGQVSGRSEEGKGKGRREDEGERKGEGGDGQEER